MLTNKILFMKKAAFSLFFIIIFIISDQLSGQTEENNSNDSTIIIFSNTEHNFGKTIQGKDRIYRFEFTNTGKSPLLISQVATSNKCIIPSWSNKPVLPGKSGRIDVLWITKKNGYFNEKITVTSNANTVILRIKGEVTNQYNVFNY